MSATTYATMRRNTSPVLQLMSDSWDAGDPWGSGMSALFAVCDVLNATGDRDRVEPGAGYEPSPYVAAPTLDEMADADEDSDETWQAVALATEVRAGRVTTDDLARASRVLHLYLDAVRGAGRDY